jgi:nucleotide-binding universal stress UspA family protein
MVKYQLHLFAERKDASASCVSDIILKCAQDLDPFLIVLAAHNQSTAGGKNVGTLGSVATYFTKQCKLPLALVRPQ